MKIEVKTIDEVTEKALYYNFDYCTFENVDAVMQDITKHMKKQLKFADLYENIMHTKYSLDSANVPYDTLFLSTDAAAYLDREYGWLCRNTKGNIAVFAGMKIIITPELESDFLIGVKNA